MYRIPYTSSLLQDPRHERVYVILCPFEGTRRVHVYAYAYTLKGFILTV